MATIHMQGRVVRDDPPEMVQLPQRDAAAARAQAVADVAPAGEVVVDDATPAVAKPKKRARARKAKTRR